MSARTSMLSCALLLWSGPCSESTAPQKPSSTNAPETTAAPSQVPFNFARCPEVPTNASDPALANAVAIARERARQNGEPMVPQELRHTLASDFAAPEKIGLLNRELPPPSYLLIGSDVTAPDVIAVPLGGQTHCLIHPGSALMLSDGASSHVAIVETVNRDAWSVEFIDPWARKSFLRAGFNLAGVAAEPILDRPDGAPRLRISMRDLMKVIRGITFDSVLEAYLPTLYPDFVAEEPFIAWATAYLYVRSDFEARVSILALASRPWNTPKMRAIGQAVADSTVGSVCDIDRPAAAEEGGVCDGIADRMRGYAAVLPWAMAWAVAQIHSDASPIGVSIAVYDIFATARPDDLDFATRRAWGHLLVNDTSFVERELPRLRAAWQQQVSSSVATETLEKAVEFLYSFTLIPHAGVQILRMRNCRLALIEAGLEARTETARVEAGARDRVATALRACEGLSPRFYFAEMLTVSSFTPDPYLEQTLLLALSNRDPKDPVTMEMATALVVHLVRRRDVRAITTPDSRRMLVELRTLLCGRMPTDGSDFVGTVPEYKRSMIAFCSHN
jgi:hypothetical protein